MVSIAITRALLAALVKLLFSLAGNPSEQLASRLARTTFTPSPYVITRAAVDVSLIQLGLGAAHRTGLQGAPAAYRAVLLRVWQWTAISDTGLGPYDPQISVLYFAGVRKVNCLHPGMPIPTNFPEYLTPRHYEAVYMILDLTRGGALMSGCAYSASQLKIPVALNTLTPLPPIVIPPTRPPITPPTAARLALTATQLGYDPKAVLHEHLPKFWEASK